MTNAVTGGFPPVATRVAAVLRFDPAAWISVPEATLAAQHQGQRLIAHDAVAATLLRICHRPVGNLVGSLGW